MRINVDARRRAVELANNLDAVAVDLGDPFSESVLHAAANRIRRNCGFSDGLKRTLILKHLKEVRECELTSNTKRIADELKFDRRDIRELVKGLAADSLVVVKPSIGSRPSEVAITEQGLAILSPPKIR